MLLEMTANPNNRFTDKKCRRASYCFKPFYMFFLCS